MDNELKSVLDRAEELLKDLEKEYGNCLASREVTERARNISHEVLEKLRNALDQTMRKSWEKHIAPNISREERSNARVYFPIADDLNSFRSILGRGHVKEHSYPKELYDFLLSRQPFSSKENKWLDILSKIAVEGKHIKLTPQKRTEIKRTTVRRDGIGSVAWDSSSTTFSSGVSVMGAPIDPRTQRIIPTPGVVQEVEIWVTFIFEGYSVNALGFCKEACQKTRMLIEDMTNRM
jgi:hypothetical protein